MKNWSTMLLLELSTPLSFFSFNALPFGFWQHFLIFDSKLSSVDIHAIHGFDNDPGVLSRLEVGKSESPKHAIVKVIIECIWLRQIQI